MSTLKQKLGTWLMARSAVSPWATRTFRVELNAMIVRLLGRVHPAWIARGRALRKRRAVLVNIGCGPFGEQGWVNLDLFAAPGVTARVDCRHRLPIADGAARGIHVEHYIEHLEPRTERPRFLAECKRCLEQGGVLRIVVPDVRKYIDAYLAPGWMALNELSGGGEFPQVASAFKIEALNHVFVQNGEHCGGFDSEYLRRTLEDAGFSNVEEVRWREGRFPGGAIDREQHRLYSLYVEARN